MKNYAIFENSDEKHSQSTAEVGDVPDDVDTGVWDRSDGEEVYFVQQAEYTGSPQWIYKEHHVTRQLHTVTGYRPDTDTITVRAVLHCDRPPRVKLEAPSLHCVERQRTGDCPCHALAPSRKRRRARSGV